MFSLRSISYCLCSLVLKNTDNKKRQPSLIKGGLIGNSAAANHVFYATVQCNGYLILLRRIEMLSIQLNAKLKELRVVI